MPLISSLNAEKMLWDTKIRAVSKTHGLTSMHAHYKDWSLNEVLFLHYLLFIIYYSPPWRVNHKRSTVVKVRALHSPALGYLLTYVDWICCSFLLFLREIFLPGTTVLPSPQKTTLFSKFQFDPEYSRQRTSFFICECITTKSLFICLSILFAYLTLFTVQFWKGLI